MRSCALEFPFNWDIQPNIREIRTLEIKLKDNRFNRTDDNPINARSLPTCSTWTKGVETIAATYFKRVSTSSASRFAGLFRGICVTFAFRAFPPTREEKEIGGIGRKEGRKEKMRSTRISRRNRSFFLFRSATLAKVSDV